LVRASPIGGLDRTLGLVFGLARGAALLVLAYIIAGMVVQVDRWPDVVLQARSLPLVYQGASWAVQRLPADHRPLLYAPPQGRETTADALLHATPQGRANGKPPVRD
jgi:membrane protein required for colicin V production